MSQVRTCVETPARRFTTTMMSYFKAARPTPFHLRRIHSSFICHTTLLFPSPSLRPTYSTSATQANAHWTVDHTGKSVVDLKFIEEPLGIPAQDGYGWPYIDFGESIGPNGRYTISRKLGFGSTSSIWLACDQRSAFHTCQFILLVTELV